jgi:alpha-amylase
MAIRRSSAKSFWLVPLLSLQSLFLTIATEKVWSGEQPIAVFHAFNQKYTDVKGFVCDLRQQGYTHVQISPAQKSNPGDQWWKRYQPVDYRTIEGLGTENDVLALTKKPTAAT